ncbi:MAG: nuclease [Halobacteriovoraceae bacterium]|jgi:deoxyribonuclease I|nr:nuclease [Halobacteriovoraceae bacterium]
MFKFVLLVGLSSILTFNASAEVPFAYNDYRDEIKKMTLDSHRPLTSYRKSRHHIMQEVHLDSDRRGYFVKEVYCDVSLRNGVGPSKMPNHQVINVEHTWPRSRFGQSKRRGGKGPNYKIKEADLHHLYPSDSKANSTRGNHVFTQFSSDTPGLSHCPQSKRGYIASRGDQGFEPPENHKGNVARALFYFAVRYNMRISEHEEFFLKQWNIIDPVDAEEVERNNKIEKIQGNRNPFVDDPDLVALINDF